LIAAFFELAGGRQDVPVVAKYIDGNLAAPGPNPPALTVVSIEAVKLPRGRARDNRRLAMLSNRVLGDLLLGGIDVEHRNVAGSSCDISERICIGELRGQRRGVLKPNLWPTFDGRLFRFADWKRRDAARRIFRLPFCKDAAHGFASSIERSASRARVRFTMSERLPSGRLIRYMPGQCSSGMMRGSRRLSVTLCGFCPSDISTVAVTLRTASVATLGRVAATLIGVPRPRARCAATRQRGPQKRAVERWGVKGLWQVWQVALIPKTLPRCLWCDRATPHPAAARIAAWCPS